VGAAILSATAAGAKPPHGDQFRGVSRAKMIAAAKAAPLKLIDYLETYCDADTAVGDWLSQLTAGEARSIAWSAGKCELVNNLNPLDGGGGYCVQATIRLKHPLARDDTPEIEIYLEDAKHGEPGPAYAFRDMFRTVDGEDYERERRAFQLQWRERFKDVPPPPCEDE
jgi:hypothetical protein